MGEEDMCRLVLAGSGSDSSDLPQNPVYLVFGWQVASLQFALCTLPKLSVWVYPTDYDGADECAPPASACALLVQKKREQKTQKR